MARGVEVAREDLADLSRAAGDDDLDRRVDGWRLGADQVLGSAVMDENICSMHSQQVRAEIQAQCATGMSDCEVSRRTGVARSTVREMRLAAEGQPLYQCRRAYVECPRCGRVARPMKFSDGDYAELLGLYLGDGYVVESGRSHRLRIYLDSKYQMIVDESAALLRRCFPSNAVAVETRYEGRMTILSVYSQHLTCLFPQHGPGLKHERSVALESWQGEIVDREPWRLLRGLIRSDGCSFINRTGPYEYLSFHFANRSKDIVDLFLASCDAVGVFCRCTYQSPRHIWELRINRRTSVAKMVEHVGIKR